jgi:hypothetical protein
LFNTDGQRQQITFNAITNQKQGTKFIQLKATSDAGVPVHFYVKEGPVLIKGSQLQFTKIPPRAKFPVKVTVVAWQYGRSTEPKLQTAHPVEQTFYITK